MSRRRRGLLSYSDKVLGTRPDALIGYWPLWEMSGSKAVDLSREGNHGAYTGVDLGQSGIGDGRTAPWFDGTSDYCNVYSAALAADVNPLEGTMLVWVRVNAASVWTDGAERRIFAIGADESNCIYPLKTSGANTLSWRYIAGGLNKNVSATTTTTDWVCLALTWSVAADELRAYLNGVQQGTTQTGLGTWAGAIASNRAVIGAGTTTPGVPWHGRVAHCALWSAPLTAAEIARLARAA